MISLYEAAHEQLVDAYEKAVLDPSRTRQARRLRELIKTNDAIVDSLIEASRTWLTSTLPELHAAGAAAAARTIGTQFAWSAPHREAVEQIAQRTWTDIATRLRDVRSDTRQALRDQVRDATRSSLLESKTATQAGQDLAKRAAADGLFSVEYSNGARHTIRDYADSVIRTTTAEAYNVGSVTQCRTDGIEYVEYFDGPDCGVGPGHNAGPLANGMVVHVDEVVYLSHPRCLRSIGSRPDITSQAQADGSEPTQGVDAVEPRVVREREPEPIRRREPRQPRTPRIPAS